MLGALLLHERPARAVPPELIAGALRDALRTRGLALLSFDDDALRLRQRIATLHALEPDVWPDVSDAALIEHADAWLLPFITDATAANALSAADKSQALLAYVGWNRQALLDELAPTHVEVPSGSRVRIDYSDPAAPVLAVRLQEMFGLADTPRIGRGRLPLTLHLLSPAQRPVQVTRDLASFWRTTYFEVRKDLRGRYPRHYWPDDPLQAEPTRRARPRG
jgi:ATP-dependent helicase HrpB